MLLVVTGAGASYDSVRERYLPGNVDPDLRPPLVTGLFAPRPGFGKALDDFYEAVPLISELRRALERGDPLERELERLQTEAVEYPPQQVGLTALRFYLQQILWETGEDWHAAAHGATNYVDLFRRLDKWRHKHGESIIYATFNYDMLLERGLTTLGMPVKKIHEYVERPDWKFIKLHGSVNWGHPIPGMSARFSQPGKVRRDVIQNAHVSSPLPDFVVTNKPTAAIKDYPLLPALAIPVELKTQFECPDEHIQIIRDSLYKIDRVLVIGWRGTERHFLELLSGSPRYETPVLIVNGSEEAAREAEMYLDSTGITGHVIRFPGGFSEFLDDNMLLERFLTEERPARAMAPATLPSSEYESQ